MKTIYTLNDIHAVLLKKYPKLEWNYEIYERVTGKKRQVTIEDFTENMFDTLALACTYKNDEYSLDVSVSYFQFLVYEDEPNIMGSGSTTRLRDNFTSDWIDLLLSEHGFDYATMLLDYSEKCKRQIHYKAVEEIGNYIKK